ncbi:MAG: nuclear transport factor 2 family protein [Chakrabartia sp.]
MTPAEMSKKWHAVALSSDENAISALLHEDAVFESPVVHTPQRGKPITVKYLASAGKVFSNTGFHYVGEWEGKNSLILEFNAEINGIKIDGIDMITWDEDGLITNFKVMVRPLKAMNMLHQKMGEILAAAA